LITTLTCNAAITNSYGPTLFSGPWILLGDFNLIRSAADKNNAQFNASLANVFNETIENLPISEVVLSDQRFTWSNMQPNPILAKLDRVFSNNELNCAFPFFFF
jgi:hypothetical protein